MNNYLTKDKRKILIGLVVQSKNVDMLLEYINWNCNFYSGEIFNENSNLILINYTPPWPHNFIFNTNTIKSYNDIFNLVFPLKTSLTMLNSLWIQKKNICNHYNNLFKVIDSIHAEFHTFLQNLISFYMFDVVEVNFKKFFDNISKYEDLEGRINVFKVNGKIYESKVNIKESKVNLKESNHTNRNPEDEEEAPTIKCAPYVKRDSTISDIGLPAPPYNP